MVSRLNELDREMKTGKKYRIFARNSGGGRKRNESDFNAILLEKMKDFYIFQLYKGYRECILKVDFIIGEYRAKEA